MCRRYLTLLALVTVLVLTGSGRAADKEPLPQGVRYEAIGEYGVERLNRILTTELAEFSSFPVTFPAARNAVRLYRVSYRTVIPEQGNRPVTVSGLVAVPQIPTKRLPMVSYQHGTVFTKTAVPSHPEESMETRLVLALFAGQGYLVIGADYIGKGRSDEPDSYLVKQSTAQACFDMLQAARLVCAELKVEPGELFLSGWSQGAWCTLVFRRKLESLNIPVKAAATASTPTDLYLLLTRWINHPTPQDARYLPAIAVLLTHSHENYLGLQGLSQAALKPEYQKPARDLYENHISYEQAEKLLPKSVKDLYQPTFAAASSLAANQLFARLQFDDAYRWRYRTPCRFYYGGTDEVVPPYVGTLPVEYQKTLGGTTAEAVYAGDQADHRGTFVFGLQNQKVWFDRLAKE